MAENYQDRPFKRNVRQRLFSDIEPAASLLTLPNAQAECVGLMQQMGIVTPQTEQVWVEYRAARYEAMKTRAAAMGLSPRIEVRDVLTWQLDRAFDVVNLDLETHFTRNLGLWLQQNQHSVFSGTTTLLLTLCLTARNGSAHDFGDWFDKDINNYPAAMASVGLTASNHAVPMRDRILLMLACALHDLDAEVDAVEIYNDGRPMICLRARVQPMQYAPLFPKFSDLVAKYEAWPDRYVGGGWTREQGQRKPPLTRADLGLPPIKDLLAKPSPEMVAAMFGQNANSADLRALAIKLLMEAEKAEALSQSGVA